MSDQIDEGAGGDNEEDVVFGLAAEDAYALVLADGCGESGGW